MKKNLFFRAFAFLTCVMFTLSTHAADEYDFVYQNLQYVITSSNTAKLVGCDITYPTGYWTVPSSANGYNVTEIAEGAFMNCSGITYISIGSNVTSIWPDAFDGCSGLTQVNTYDLAAWCNISFIGNASANPLYYARHLYLNQNEITELTVPDGVQTLGSFVFYRCEGLTSAIIANSVTSIGWSCFNACSNLKTLVIGSGVTSISSHAFANNPSLTSVTCLATTPPTLSASNVFSDNTYNDVTLLVPKGCKSAYQAADFWSNFANIVEIAYDFFSGGIYYNITGSNTVEVTYRDSSFNSYSGDVNIPPTVTYNGTTYQVTTIGQDAFHNSRNLTSVTIPPTITLMNNFAFANCTGLTRVDISDLVAWCRITFSGSAAANPLTMAHHLYLNGIEVTDLTIPDGIHELNNLVFFGCVGLTHVTIPQGLTSIGWSSFNQCSNLMYVKLGCDLSYIDQYAFSYCPSLNEVICQASTPPVMGASNVFDIDTYSQATLSVPKQSLNAYQTTDWWNEFSHIGALNYDFIVNGIYYAITGDNTVKVTNNGSAGTYDGTVNIPQSVTWNGDSWQVTAIDDYAFQSCSELTSVTIPNSVTTIGDRAFTYCTALTSITIPNSVTDMGSYVFAHCEGLNFASISNNVTVIKNSTFADCPALTDVVIGKAVTDISSYAFRNCSALKCVTCLPATPPTMADRYVFSNTAYSNATLFVPKASTTTYKTANWWKNFNSLEPHLDYALNTATEAVTFTSTGDYDWINAKEGDRIYAKSGNKGVHSSTSELTTTVNLPAGGTLSFEFKAWGEGTSTFWDECCFMVDNTVQFKYGALKNDWETYTILLDAGTHTLTWKYTKDYSVNPLGDYFAVDNVVITANNLQRGDVNGDGDVDISDVTDLIDMLLGSGTSCPGPVDCNQDGEVDISDVTALIDYLLNGYW